MIHDVKKYHILQDSSKDASHVLQVLLQGWEFLDTLLIMLETESSKYSNIFEYLLMNIFGFGIFTSYWQNKYIFIFIPFHSKYSY